PVGLKRGLGVLPGRGAGRGVAGVADAEVALECRERRLVEDLGDEPELLIDEEVPAVGDRDARRLLAAVLLGEETEVAEPGDLFSGSPHPEETALLFWTLASHSADANTGPNGSERLSRCRSAPRRSTEPRPA